MWKPGGILDRARPYRGIDEFSVVETGARWSLTLRPDEPVFAGHYPGNPILPGIYTLESLQQGVEHFYALAGKRAVLRKVKSMRFLAPFVPRDRMEVSIVADSDASGEALVSAIILRNGQKAAAAKLTFMLEELPTC